MVLEAYKAAEILKEVNIQVEVVDIRSLRPLDTKTIISSVKKTKRLLVVDSGWMTYGISAEIISVVCEAFNKKNQKNNLSKNWNCGYPDSKY